MNLKHLFIIIIALNLFIVFVVFMFELYYEPKYPPYSKKTVDKFLQFPDDDTENELDKLQINDDYQNILMRTPYYQDLYKQINPFHLLGAYDDRLSLEYFNDNPGAKPKYNTPDMGLINDPNYCDYVDTYNLMHPNNIFLEKNILTDYNFDGLARQMFREVGNDVMPTNVSKDMPSELFNKRTYNIPINTTFIFSKKVRMFYFHEFGRHLYCLSQMFNHIPGHGSLTRKDLNVESINNYAKKFLGKGHCYKQDQFFPASYRLENYTECKQFFEIFNKEEYQQLKRKEGLSYLAKVSWGSHRANGIELVFDEFELRLRRKYQNGALCGQILDNLMMQKYIADPDLNDGRKYDFRVYMLIASTNPLIVYYHDGFLRNTFLQYDKFSKERTIHLANTNLAKEYFEHWQDYYETFKMNETELRNWQMWNMSKFQNYMLEKGKTKDQNWLDNYLRPQLQMAYIHMAMMTQHSYLKDSRVFEMFGLDFLLDSKLNLWFIECNASPVIQGTSEEKAKFQGGMLKDLVEIEYAYLRSRWKRIRNFINKMQDQIINKSADFAKLKLEFNEISKNKLEPEFQISANNTFVKILDLNLKGKEAFHNLFEEDCFDQ